MDVGGVTLLGLHTARETYPTAAPVTATLTLHARDVASATLTLLLDGDPVLTTPLTLTGGVDEITVAVPAPLPPSRNTLIGRVEAAGLEHHRSHTFVYGTDVVDLVPASPYVNGSAGVTRTLRTRVYNRGRTASVTTTLQLWDGDPAGGGTLLGESAVPPLRPGASERLELAWDVRGGGGSHTLYAVIDPDDHVSEFHEDNNTTTVETTLPRFALQVGTAQETYTVGDTVPIHVHATNLMSAEAEDLTITVTARYAGQLQAFEDVRPLQLSPLGEGNFAVQWDTAGLLGGAYTLSAQGQDQAGQRDLATMHVQLQQEPRQQIFLPLVMHRAGER